jgi:hypothetical protein
VKPTLVCKEKKVLEVNFYDLEEFIKEMMGKTYEVVAHEEWHNYSSYPFTVNADHTSDALWEEVMALSKSSGRWPPLQEMLNEAARRGYIENGNYLIEVSW